MSERMLSNKESALNLGRAIRSGEGIAVLGSSENNAEVKAVLGINDACLKALKERYNFRRF